MTLALTTPTLQFGGDARRTSLLGNIGTLTSSEPISRSILANIGSFNASAPMSWSVLGNLGKFDLAAPLTRSFVANAGDARISGGGVSDSFLLNLGKLDISAPVSYSVLGNLGSMNIDSPVLRSVVGNIGRFSASAPIIDSLVGNIGTLSLDGPVKNSIVGNIGGSITMRRDAAAAGAPGKHASVEQSSRGAEVVGSGTPTKLPKYPSSFIFIERDTDLSGFDLSDVVSITNFGHDVTVNDTLKKHAVVTNTGNLRILGEPKLEDAWLSNIGGHVEIG